ncbi:MAG: hypothetical protein R2731_00440 [Nocardioides sp.]
MARFFDSHHDRIGTHHLSAGPVDRDRSRISAELAAIDAHASRRRSSRRLLGLLRASR